MKLTMHVHFGDQEVVFQNSDLMVEPIELTRSAGADVIEQDDVRVTTRSVKDGADFFGLNPSITSFGQGRYIRVKLEDADTGEVVFNGICYPEDIDYDAPTDTFRWTLLGGKDELMRRLQQVYLLDLDDSGITSYSSRIYKRRQSTLANDSIETTGYSEDVQPWYQSTSVATAVCNSGYQLVDKTPVPNYYQRIGFTSGSGGVYERPVSLFIWSGYPPGDSTDGGQNVGDLWPQNPSGPFLPPWTGERFFEVLAAMSGWRLQPKFEAYPSDGLEVYGRRLRWAADEATSSVGISALELAEGHGLYRNAPPSEGISLENDIGESAPLQKPKAWRPPSSSVENEFDVRLPGIGAAAARTWETEIAEPDEGDPRSLDVSLQSVDVRVPGVLRTTSMSTTQTIGDYEETVYYGYPIVANRGGICYVTSFLGGDKGFEDNRVIYLRRPAAPDAGTRPVIAEHWADAMYEAREWLHQRHQLLEGRYERPDASAPDVDVGDLEGTAIDAEGKRWAAEEIVEDLDQDTWSVQIERPDEEGAPAALPDSINRTLNARSRLTEIELTSGDKRQVAVVQWDPPGAAWCRAIEYEIEHEFNGSGYQSYRYNRTFATYAVIETERIYGTTFDSTDLLTVRIRAHGLDGQTSEWAIHGVRKE